MENSSSKKNIQLVSPDGEVAVVTDLNAMDLKRDGWMAKTDVEAAVEAQRRATKIADKLAEAGTSEDAESNENSEADEDDEGDSEIAPEPSKRTLEEDSVAQGFSAVDTFLESLDDDALRKLLKDKYDVTAHHKAGTLTLIAKIKENAEM